MKYKYHLVDKIMKFKTVEASTLDEAAKLLGVKIIAWSLSHSPKFAGFATTDKGFGVWWEEAK